MDKVLSVIIPTYNMEGLLPRCLDSLCGSSRLDLLDIIVVNDGSRDNSLAVAQGYAERHAGSIKVIDKPNGNYGSTINAALPELKGRYVKILDADDEFDTTMLDSLLGKLATADTDVVVTPFTEIHASKPDTVVRYNTMGREPYLYDTPYDMDGVLGDGYIRFFLMHGLIYRSKLLTDNGYRQTEGVSYTDLEWATYPIYYAKSIMFCRENVYRYHLDRGGQTMDPAVLARQAGQLVTVSRQLLEFYAAFDLKAVSAARRAWLHQYHENRMRIIYKLYLLDMPREAFSAGELRSAEGILKPLAEKMQLMPSLYPDNKILRIDYIAYWQRHGRRWPAWLEAASGALDRLAHYIYDFLRRK